MKGYTTEQKIADYLGITLIPGMFDDKMEAVELYVDNATGQSFVATEEVRYFDGKDSEVLRIDNCISIIKVELGSGRFGGDFTEFTSYVTKPNNSTRINGILATNGQVFFRGVQNYRITAKWGYSLTAPKDISDLCTRLVAGMYRHEKNGGVASEKIGNYSVSYKEDEGKTDQAVIDFYKEIIL